MHYDDVDSVLGGIYSAIALGEAALGGLCGEVCSTDNMSLCSYQIWEVFIHGCFDL